MDEDAEWDLSEEEVKCLETPYIAVDLDFDIPDGEEPGEPLETPVLQ